MFKKSLRDGGRDRAAGGGSRFGQPEKLGAGGREFCRSTPLHPVGSVQGVKSTCLLLALFTVCVSAQTNRPIAVTLEVTAAGELRTQIESFCRRELRSLGDVEIVEAGGQFSVQICAVAVMDQGQVDMYALSTVFLKAFDKNNIRVRFGDKLNDGDIGLHDIFTAVSFEVVGHGVATAGRNRLKSSCEKTNAEFDATVLEGARREPWHPVPSVRGPQLENNALIIWTFAHTNGGIYIGRDGNKREISAAEIPKVRAAAFERRDQLFLLTREESAKNTAPKK